MKNMLYKNYAAHIEYSEADGCLVGHIAGISDIVGFDGQSVQEIRAAFEEAVDDYIEFCEEQGIPPKRPYSGKIMLRLHPSLHADIAMKAEASGKSLNQWAVETLAQA
jgi:predicted HicB family RNase H-like nuclease